MLSIDLFDSKYERRLHEGAVDRLEQHRIDVLNDRMQELLARARTATPDLKASLKKHYEKIKSERDSYYKIREAQTGQDVVDRKAKMKALTPAKPGAVGAVKDVAQGLKNFLQGKPETGPTYESQKKKLELDHGVIPTEPLPEHGGGIGPRQHWQDLMPEQTDPEDDWYDDADEFGMPGSEFFPDEEDNRLKDGDYVRDRQDGEYGEIFRMSGDPTERRVRILDRDGKGWYISPERLEPVDRNDPDIMKYFGKRRHRHMDEEELLEGIKDTASATAVITCLLTGGSLSGCATAPQQTTAQQVLKTGQDVGRTVQSAKRITRASAEAEVQQEIRNVLRGINRPEELNNSNILRIWKRIKGQPPVQPEPQAPEYGPAEPVKRPTSEDKDPTSKQEYIAIIDRLDKEIDMERDRAVKQMLMSRRAMLQQRAQNAGWIPKKELRETNASLAAEQAILKRIMVAHTDLLKQFGLEKVMQAAEEVAYNVGDVDEIGTSDVSGWVRQVQQILGAAA